MKRTFAVVWLLTIVIVGNVASQDIYSLIQAGRIDDAHEAIRSASPGVNRDANLLFFRALLEPEADSASAHFEAAVANGADDQFAQECYYRLAQLASLARKHEIVIQWCTDYVKRYPKGQFLTEMARLHALALEATGHPTQSLDMIDQGLKQRLGKRATQQLTIDKARVLTMLGKPVGANSILTKITREADGESVPQALHMLAFAHLKGGKAEEAGRYYALLFEEYPLSVGLGLLEDQISSAPAASPASDQAERVTSTFYSVKVGVFSSIENARAQAALFAGKAKPIDVVKRTIQGKPYHIVFVGKFQDYEAAARLRTELQQMTGEKYEVAAR